MIGAGLPVQVKTQGQAMQMAKSRKRDDAHGALGHARKLAKFQEGTVGHPRQAVEQQDRDQRRQHRVDIVGQHVDRLFVEVGTDTAAALAKARQAMAAITRRRKSHDPAARWEAMWPECRGRLLPSCRRKTMVRRCRHVRSSDASRAPCPRHMGDACGLSRDFGRSVASASRRPPYDIRNWGVSNDPG